MKNPPYAITRWTHAWQRWIRLYADQTVYLVTGGFVDRFGEVEPLIGASPFQISVASSVGYMYTAISSRGMFFIQDIGYTVVNGHQLTRATSAPGEGEPVDGIPWLLHDIIDPVARVTAMAEFIAADL